MTLKCVSHCLQRLENDSPKWVLHAFPTLSELQDSARPWNEGGEIVKAPSKVELLCSFHCLEFPLLDSFLIWRFVHWGLEWERQLVVVLTSCLRCFEWIASFCLPLETGKLFKTLQPFATPATVDSHMPLVSSRTCSICASEHLHQDALQHHLFPSRRFM